MKERPILFNGEMVRAILAGRKTQTRRVMRQQPEFDETDQGWLWPSKDCRAMVDLGIAASLAPLGRAGDRLWVRETWGVHYLYSDLKPSDIGEHKPDCIWYRASGDECVRGKCSPAQRDKWRPSIHMPRWASRIDLEITGVRVERVQDASHSDLGREGWDAGGRDEQLAFVEAKHDGGIDDAVIEWFADLWDSVSPPEYEWDANPFVWVYEFRRVPS